MSFKSFSISDMKSKIDVLMSILTFFCQKFGRGNTLPTPTLLLGFTANTEHQRVGEVMPGCGLQCSAAPVNIPISYRSQAA